MQPLQQLAKQSTDPSFIAHIYDNPVGKSAYISELALEIQQSRSRSDHLKGVRKITPAEAKANAKKMFRRIRRYKAAGLSNYETSERLGFTKGYVGSFMRRWGKIAKQEGWGG